MYQSKESNTQLTKQSKTNEDESKKRKKSNIYKKGVISNTHSHKHIRKMWK